MRTAAKQNPTRRKSNGSNALKAKAARVRQALVKRFKELKRGAAQVEVTELEAALRIATDLDAREQPEGPLGKMVRDLFDAHLDGVRHGEIAFDLEDMLVMARLAQRFVLRGRFKQDPRPRA